MMDRGIWHYLNVIVQATCSFPISSSQAMADHRKPLEVCPTI